MKICRRLWASWDGKGSHVGQEKPACPEDRRKGCDKLLANRAKDLLRLSNGRRSQVLTIGRLLRSAPFSRVKVK